MLIDTHSHVNFSAFKNDSDEVIKRALDNNVQMVNVGSQYSSSRRAVEYGKKYPKGVYAAVGLHPLHLEEVKIGLPDEGEFESRKEILNTSKYKELTTDAKTVAIGEIGLDYYHVEDKTFRLNIELSGEKGLQDNKELISKIIRYQKQIFKEQLKLAVEIDKPVIVHCRTAHKDTSEILSNVKKEYSNLRGVIHCFSGDLEQAKKYISMGFLIGFTGLITFVDNWEEVIKNIDLNKILLETDCPYLTPVPFRGKRNEPLYVKYVAEKIAEIKEVDFDEVAKQTTKNAKEIFNLLN